MNEQPKTWTISYDAEASDLQAGYSLFKKICKSAGRSTRILRVIAVFAFVLVAFESFREHTITPGVIGVGVGALFLIFGVPWQTRRQLTKLFKTLAAPHTTLPITVRFDDEQISFTLSGKSEAKFFWSGVLGVAEDEAVFILMPTKISFYYIPKRALASEVLEQLRLISPKMTSKC